MLRRVRSIPRALVLGELTGVVVMATALTAVPATATQTMAANGGHLVISMNAPKGVATQALLPDDIGASAIKPGSSDDTTVELDVPAGAHEIEPLAATLKGQVYEATAAPGAVEVEAGQTTRVALTWRKVARQVDVGVTETTADSVSLEWRSDIKNAKYVVRRAVGDTAPATRKDGSAVTRGDGVSVRDAGLAPDTTYTYAVFAHGQGGWQPATTVTTATLPTGLDASKTASFALLPHATLVKPGDLDVASVVDGEVWVQLAPTRPAPVLGAGMVLPVSQALSGGFMGRIAEVSADGRSVRLEQTGYPGVFSHYKLSTTFEKTIDYEPIVVNNPPAGAIEGGTASRRTLARAEESDNCLQYSALDLELRVDPSLTAVGTYKTEVISDYGWPHAVEADVDVTVTGGVDMDMKVGKELSCFLGVENFYSTVTTYPVPTAIRWEAGLKFAASGAAEVQGMGVTASATLGGVARIGSNQGFIPDSGGFTGDLLEPTGEGSAEASVGVGGEMTYGPGVGFKDDAGVIAGIGGTLDLFKASVEGALGSDEDNSCLKVTGETGGSLRLHAAAVAGPLETEAEFVVLDGSHEWGSRTWPVGCDEVDPDLGSGDVQATLTWTSGDDLDLHVIDPSGEEIYYNNPTSASGGQLDVDRIPGCAGDGSENVENIFWPTGESPSGFYKVWVHEYSDCDPVEGEWTLTLRIEGVVVLRRTGTGTSQVYNFISSEN